MKKMITFSAIRFFFMFVLATPVYSAELTTDPSAQIKVPLHSTVADTRVVTLQDYLEKHKSPLAPYAEVFVKKADEYNLPDWRLVPAITGVESTFGKAIPKNSYNAYGWANGAYSFESWEESIDIVTKTLKVKYMDRGANTVEKIGRIYAPPSQTWARNVNFFMGKIAAHIPLSTEPTFSL